MVLKWVFFWFFSQACYYPVIIQYTPLLKISRLCCLLAVSISKSILIAVIVLAVPVSSSTTVIATPGGSRSPRWWGTSPPPWPAGPSWTSSRTPTVTLLSGSFWCWDWSNGLTVGFLFLQAVAASPSWSRWRVSTRAASRESSTRCVATPGQTVWQSNNLSHHLSSSVSTSPRIVSVRSSRSFLRTAPKEY